VGVKRPVREADHSPPTSAEVKNAWSYTSTRAYVFVAKGDNSVGIALGYGLDDRGSRFRFPVGAGNFSLHHRVQNGSEAHPASCPMGTRGSFPGGKAAGSWSWPLTSILCRGQRMSGAIPPLPNTPSWRGAQLKKAQRQLYSLYLSQILIIIIIIIIIIIYVCV
jgi:hypothetical protein